MQGGVTLVVSQFALPYGYAVPAHCGQFALFLGVTLTVTVDFVAPKLMVGFGQMAFGAVVAVPEAAVNEDAGAVFA